MSEFRNELIRIIKSPKLVFNRGIMSKPMDSVQGFVSDLTNMEIDGEGVAKRRMGSFCLLNPDDDREWVLYFASKVSGCDLIFLIDFSGNIYCVSENFPEILFVLNRSGFTKLYYPDTDSFSHEVRFDRGTKFFYVDRPETLTMMNDFGDTITINKAGSIRFLGTSDQQESYETASRRDFDNVVWASYGVYVNVKFTRKKIINTFDLIPISQKTYDPERKFIPAINSIQGEIKVAQVDSDGRIGRTSPAQFISRYGEYIVSLVTGYSFEGSAFSKRGIFDFNSVLSPQFPQENSKKTRIFARRVNEDTTTATLSDVDIECESLPYEFKGRSFGEDYAVAPQRRTCMIGLHPDTLEDPQREFLKATMWMDYSFAEDEEEITIREFCPSNIGCLLRATALRMFRRAWDGTTLQAKITGGGGLFFEDAWAGTTGKGSFSQVDIDEIPIYVTKAKYCEIVPYLYAADLMSTVDTITGFESVILKSKAPGEAGYPGILYEVLIGLPKNYIHQDLMTFSLADNAGAELPVTGIRTTGFTRIYRAEIPFFLDTTGQAPVPQDFYPAQWMYDVPKNSNVFVGLRNLGYDCWTAKKNLTIESNILDNADKYDINIMGKMTPVEGLSTEIYDDLAKKYDIVVDQAEYEDWFKSGSRFAVMNNGRVIAVSQRCFADSDNLIPIYKKSMTVTGTREINYQADIDMIGYLPVCALENIYIRGFMYESPVIQKDIDKAKDIVENAGSVFLLENGRIWIGSNVESLVFNATTALPDTTNIIAKFDNGVLAFCKDTIKFIYPNGKFNDVQGLSQFKNVTCVKAKWLPDGSVYAVTSAGEIAKISVQYTESNDKFYMAQNISYAISDVVFTHETDMAFSNNTIWFSRINDVYGFTRNGWMHKSSFGDNIIKGIFTYKDELCIIFNNGVPKGRIKPPSFELSIVTG